MQLLVLVVLSVAFVHPVACSRAHADGHAEQQTASLHIPKHTIREEYTFYILKAALTGYILATPSVAVALEVGKEDTELTQYPMDADKRRKGEDWPLYGVTMTGLLRLDVLEMALKYVVQHHVPGDFLEAGVWRGGSSIFARAAWNLLGQYHRSVHVADSFAGLPRGSVEQDQRVAFHKMGYLAVSLEDVKANFERFGLNPDAGVHFYKGFFNESLPAFRESFKGSLSVLRLDGDMYESATDQLYNLYDFVSPGGWIIVDDYNTIPETQSGVNDFLKRHNAHERITITHDSNAGYWVKTNDFQVDYEWYREWCKTRKYDRKRLLQARREGRELF